MPNLYSMPVPIIFTTKATLHKYSPGEPLSVLLCPIAEILNPHPKIDPYFPGIAGLP